jgi:hypothetical protein
VRFLFYKWISLSSAPAILVCCKSSFFERFATYTKHSQVETITDDLGLIETLPDFVEDTFDTEYQENGDYETELITSLGTSNYTKALIPLPKRRVCALCNNDSETASPFVRPNPFILPLTETEKKKHKKKVFWIHEACAKFSPEVLHFEGEISRWFNVAEAVRRGRNLQCAGCRGRGATIGCFEPKCPKSYHLECTMKPLKKFEDGLIFWCTTHEVKYSNVDDYEDVFNCDMCNISLGVENDLALKRTGVSVVSTSFENQTWYSCSECASHFKTFDLCKHCFTKTFPRNHPHSKEHFRKTNVNDMRKLKINDSQRLLDFMKQRSELL